jgi:hypothetical protein
MATHPGCPRRPNNKLPRLERNDRHSLALGILLKRAFSYNREQRYLLSIAPRVCIASPSI